MADSPLSIAKFLSRLGIVEVEPAPEILMEMKVLLAESDCLNAYLESHDDVAVRWAMVEDSP